MVGWYVRDLNVFYPDERLSEMFSALASILSPCDHNRVSYIVQVEQLLGGNLATKTIRRPRVPRRTRPFRQAARARVCLAERTQ